MCDGSGNLCAWWTVEEETFFLTVYLCNITVKRRPDDLSAATEKQLLSLFRWSWTNQQTCQVYQ